MDYFLARYYSSTQGRFTSADPLLSSGRLEDPQTWNRYAYTLNSPLKFVDPTGLFTIGPGATPEETEQIIAAYHALRAARSKLKEGSKAYINITQALERLGGLGEENGVVVTVGRTRDPKAGGETNVDEITKGIVTITLNRKTFASDRVQERAAGLAHEAIHTDDAFNLVATSNSMADFKRKWRDNDFEYTSEYEGFFAQTGVYQTIGLKNGIYGYGWYTRPNAPGKAPYLPERLELWNPSWRELDQKQIESKQRAVIQTIIESPRGSGPAALYGLKRPQGFQP